MHGGENKKILVKDLEEMKPGMTAGKDQQLFN
jgi:hypothetical protein